MALFGQMLRNAFRAFGLVLALYVLLVRLAPFWMPEPMQQAAMEMFARGMERRMGIEPLPVDATERHVPPGLAHPELTGERSWQERAAALSRALGDGAPMPSVQTEPEPAFKLPQVHGGSGYFPQRDAFGRIYLGD